MEPTEPILTTKEKFLKFDRKMIEHSDPKSAIFEFARNFNKIINQEPKIRPTISRKDFMIFSNIVNDDGSIIEVIIPVINKDTTIDDIRSETARYTINRVHDGIQEQEVIEPIETDDIVFYIELMERIINGDQFKDSIE